MTEKTEGQIAYEADRVREPYYRATGDVRPQWDELGHKAQEAWERKVNDDGA